jgi:hypothetical protein
MEDQMAAVPHISPNRAVTALTPLLFAPLAGAISVFAAANVPGLDIDTEQLQAVFIAGATIAFGKAALWLKGWQEFEQREAAVATADSEVRSDFDDGDLLGDEAGVEEDEDIDGVDLSDEPDFDEDLDDAGLLDDQDSDDVLDGALAPAQRG